MGGFFYAYLLNNADYSVFPSAFEGKFLVRDTNFFFPPCILYLINKEG